MWSTKYEFRANYLQKKGKCLFGSIPNFEYIVKTIFHAKFGSKINKENVEFYENSNFGGRVEIMTPSYCNNADINMTLNEREDVWDLFNL